MKNNVTNYLYTKGFKWNGIMIKNSCLQNGYVRCPHCGHIFKNHKLERYTIGALSGSGKLIGHVGFRTIGSSLGVTIGKVDIG